MNPTAKFSEGLKQQTEKALKTINQYQKLKQTPIHTILSSLRTQPYYNINMLNIRIFQPKQKVKLQLLPNCLLYYKIHIVPNIDPKLIIRHFKGGPIQIFVFYDKILRELDQAAHRFFVKDEMILKFSKNRVQQAKSIILVFKNSINLCMLSFRVDLIKPAKRKIGELKTDKSFDSIDLSVLDGEQTKLKRSRSRQKHKSSSIHKKIKSVSPQQKQKKLQQQRELKLQKKQAIKKRIQNLEIYKQKHSQATKVVTSCKKMFSIYQNLVKEEQQKKKQLIKINIPMLYAIKYCFISSMFFSERQKNLRRKITIKSYENKFIRRIRRAYYRTKKMQPDPNLRQLQVFSQINNFIGYALNKKNENKATKIAFTTLQSCFSGLLINHAMNESNSYRRIVRGVQKRWKSKFQARTTMLIMYAQQQLQIILSTYPNLKYVQKQYIQGNSSYKICIQYQKETANKMIHLIQAYYQKLQQISEYQQMNKQIKQFNATALKKRQRQLLDVPNKPAYPYFRFFRDLLFLKSMVRSELQVLFRKFKKKNPQLFTAKAQEQVQIKLKAKNIK